MPLYPSEDEETFEERMDTRIDIRVQQGALADYPPPAQCAVYTFPIANGERVFEGWGCRVIVTPEEMEQDMHDIIRNRGGVGHSNPLFEFSDAISARRREEVDAAAGRFREPVTAPPAPLGPRGPPPGGPPSGGPGGPPGGDLSNLPSSSTGHHPGSAPLPPEGQNPPSGQGGAGSGSQEPPALATSPRLLLDKSRRGFLRPRLKCMLPRNRLQLRLFRWAPSRLV